MKIIAHPIAEPTPASPPEPSRLRIEYPDTPASAPIVDVRDQVKDLLQEFAERAVVDMNRLEQQLEQAQVRQADQFAKTSQTIARVVEEMAAFRKALEDLRSAPQAPAAVTVPIVPVSEPAPMDPKIFETLNTMAQDISKLTGEMATLKQTVADLKRPETPKSTPKPEPQIIKKAGVTPEPKPIEKSLAKPESKATPKELPATKEPARRAVIDFIEPLDDSPKKVAFLTKLWDYLNQVAVEIPHGRKDR